MNVEELTNAVLQKLAEKMPRALLIGDPPEIDHNYNYVNEEPYEAIMIGRLTPQEMFCMPTDAVCYALLEQKPVYLWDHQLWKESKTARVLCRELTAAQQRLYRLGVKPVYPAAGVLTAQEARALLQSGRKPPGNCRMTPLARDILEGKEV